jgi:transglutaminase-like putative cysteine protease
MKRYRVTHTTMYEYAESVPVCQNQMHLAPRSTPAQACRNHRLVIRPRPTARRTRLDYFGNSTEFVSVDKAHKELRVTAVSEVDVHALELAKQPSAPWEAIRERLQSDRSPIWLDAYQFCFESPLVRGRDAALRKSLLEYAQPSFFAGRSILESAHDLTSRIHADFRYDSTTTSLYTPLEQVLQQRSGVCQDLAHIEIGCLRAMGLAARYVSGYLLTRPPPGKQKLIGADASHAWIAVFAGEVGWVDFDPTNDVSPGDEHITLAWGRDYSDVCPIEGVYVGGGASILSVQVDVQPLSGQDDDSLSTPFS